MSATIFIFTLIGTACALIIFVRAVNVLRHMDVRKRSRNYITWLAFGISYALLATAAAGALFALWGGRLDLGYLIWLAASAGLILFDRRPPRIPRQPDSDSTLPFGRT